MAGLILELTEAGGESRLGISWLERIAGIWNGTRPGYVTYTTASGKKNKKPIA